MFSLFNFSNAFANQFLLVWILFFEVMFVKYSLILCRVKKDINPVVISLCQDVSGDVRSAMSVELPNVSATLGLETSNYLLNHILDLVSDEDILVRKASVEAVAQMLPRFSQGKSPVFLVFITAYTWGTLRTKFKKIFSFLSKIGRLYYSRSLLNKCWDISYL